MTQVRRKVSKDGPRLVAIGPMQLEGILTVPEPVTGLVIFAHGSGSSRLSPRNTYVAEQLQRRSIATLLFDLLTEQEASDRRNVFHVPLLADRLEVAEEVLRAALGDAVDLQLVVRSLLLGLCEAQAPAKRREGLVRPDRATRAGLALQRHRLGRAAGVEDGEHARSAVAAQVHAEDGGRDR